MPPPSGAGMWTKGPVLSAPRQEIGAAALGGLVFVVGGQGANGVITEAYDPKTGKWEVYDPMPVRVDHPNTAAVGDKLYVLGGAGTSNVWEYNPLAAKADRKWVMKARLASPRNAAAVGVVGNKIHLAGGSQNTKAVDIHDVYDPVSNDWDTSVAPLPEAREHVPGAVVNGIFYVISGRAAYAPGSPRNARVDAYDPATNMWTRKTDIPTPRGGAGAAVLGNVIVVVGGEGNPAPGSQGVFPVAEEFDPATNKWRTLAAPLTPRHGAYAVGIDGKLYWPLGTTSQGGGPDTNVFEIFSY